MAKHYYQYDDGSVIVTDAIASWCSGTKLSAAAGRVAYQAYCVRELRKLLKPKDVVYVTVTSASISGMSRTIKVLIPSRAGDGKKTIRNISTWVAGAIGESEGKDGVIMRGAGMDMGFALVYSLGYALWPKGTRKPHGTRNGQPDTNGGYALTNQWI